MNGSGIPTTGQQPRHHPHVDQDLGGEQRGDAQRDEASHAARARRPRCRSPGAAGARTQASRTRQPDEPPHLGEHGEDEIRVTLREEGEPALRRAGSRPCPGAGPNRWRSWPGSRCTRSRADRETGPGTREAAPAGTPSGRTTPAACSATARRATRPPRSRSRRPAPTSRATSTGNEHQRGAEVGLLARRATNGHRHQRGGQRSGPTVPDAAGPTAR